jgi:hypothetical protein
MHQRNGSDTRKATQFHGTQAYLQSHPAINGMTPASLDAWPVYTTNNDLGRRHKIDNPSFISQTMVDVGVPQVL